MTRLVMLSRLALTSMVLTGCGASSQDSELACSIVRQNGWVRAPSGLRPEGVPARRLTPKDRDHVYNSSLWRVVKPPEQFDRDPTAFCGSTTRADVASMHVSKDATWARVVFQDGYGEETCLAKRNGETWRERECDITMIVDPEI